MSICEIVREETTGKGFTITLEKRIEKGESREKYLILVSKSGLVYEISRAGKAVAGNKYNAICKEYE